MKEKVLRKREFFLLFLLFTSRGTSRDGTGQAVKILSRPIPWQDFELVPLFRCPGTKKNPYFNVFFVPGQSKDFCPYVPQQENLVQIF